MESFFISFIILFLPVYLSQKLAYKDIRIPHDLLTHHTHNHGFNITQFISSSILADSIINRGSIPSLLQDKINRNECLTIISIGGSNTCGKTNNDTDPDRPGDTSEESRKNTYPIYLDILLNNIHPCQPKHHVGAHDLPADYHDIGKRHVSINLGEGGTGSDYWSDRINFARTDETHIVNKLIKVADIIIVETSVNDLDWLNQHSLFKGYVSDDWRHDSNTNIQLTRIAELLVNVIYFINKDILQIWLGLTGYSWKPKQVWQGESPRDTDCSQYYLNITRHYDIPQISVIDATGPYLTEEEINWFLYTFRSDSINHITRTGHKLNALLLLNYISNIYDKKIPSKTIDLSSIEPLIWNKTELEKYRKYPAFRLELLDQTEMHRMSQFISWTSDCKHLTDVTGKPGLLCYGTDNTDKIEYVLITIPAKMVPRFTNAGIIHLMVLKSYSTVGSLRLTVSRGSQLSSDSYVKSVVINCLWDLHMSVAVLEEIPYDNILINDSKFENEPLLVNISVVPGRKPGQLFRIKLISFTLM